ncbi:Bug family tripartite tricarboxylate transporter substrate binding protein [Comamonas endophytica]|uniref:Tripartite tricarboxylate transporter substrate binding protein n=1 Tax=Comamonas endophytica TaxID=2949090 RepID=A0ABY6GA73_9BURK|nr:MULTISPECIES: tripartite tricarboxylate transporter substrate binding protein [unclassified Acidovorax]MCD2512048.1 tripartite tricarboxylate transporter substrate binding protein [Acidovorax sp. D4N7]UYG51828.1 tripartite tricarboxylate transporter substrate binding protein [Acidovorax sp. 5MLIR]
MHRRLALIAAACSATCLFAPAAQASEWPTAKPITWVVPFAPGGSTDVVARMVGQELSTALKQSVVVENRPGAGGGIGVQAVARAPADGYTLIGGTISTHAINSALYKKLPYDPVKDFEPVTLIAYVPNVLMVNSALGVNTVQELVEWIRKNPEKASYASSGAGTSTHLTGAQMAELIKVPMQHVAYKGSPQALQDVAAGNVPFLFDQLTAGLPLVKAGKLKFLAVTTKTRSPLAPDVPTTAEAGFPGLDLVSWQGVYAPKGTPKEVVARLNTEIVKALKTPELKSKFETQFGMQVVGSSPVELARVTAADIARLGELVRKTGATTE